jgi:2,3,4,5-tetrahydropyridine-2-carboxylate N-succinyltransferase
MRANFVESNPVPVKTALARLGRCGEVVRPPLGPPETATRRVLDDALRRGRFARDRRMTNDVLRASIERLAASPEPDREEARAVVDALLLALEEGSVRAAEPEPPAGRSTRGSSAVSSWPFVAASTSGSTFRPFTFAIGTRCRRRIPRAGEKRPDRSRRLDRATRRVSRRRCRRDAAGVRQRRRLRRRGSMVDSHALVGSCAQIGAHVHLSAAVQVGGVLEPPGAMPVIVEDHAFVGGGCGLYEGTRVGRGRGLGPGGHPDASADALRRGARAHDRADAAGFSSFRRGRSSSPEVGRRRATWARSRGLTLYAPVIVKYRDAATDAAAALEEALR